MRIDEGMIDVLTPSLLPRLDDSDLLAKSYPHVPLQISDDRQIQSLRSVTLTNDWLEATLAPDLGGRILRLRVLETGYDLLGAFGELDARVGGVRGAEVISGIEWLPLGTTSGPGPAPIDWEQREDESGVPLVVMHTLPAGVEASVHCSVYLQPDEPCLCVVLTVQNLGHRSLALDRPGLLFEAAEWSVGDGRAGAWGCPDGAWMLAVTCPEEIMDAAGRVAADHGFIAPYETFACRFEIRPVRNPVPAGRPVAVSGRSALFIDGEYAFISAGAAVEGELHLTTARDESFQAPVSLGAGEGFSAGLVGGLAETRELVLRDRAGDIEWRWPAPMRTRADRLPAVECDSEGSANHPLLRLGHALHAARDAIAAQAWSEASNHLDAALAWHAENPLVWWLKCAVARHDPHSDEESLTETAAAAHYFAPLEPLLRAESFLSQPAEMGREPSPLIAPLAGHPEALAHVAVALVQWGMLRDAARWLDECLRHREWPNLRLLYAWLLLTESRMEFEAAAQVKLLDDAPIEPPFPWRRLERRAVRDLAARFPDNARLARLARLLDRAETFGR